MADSTITTAPSPERATPRGANGPAISIPVLAALADDLGEDHESIIAELVDLYLDEGAQHVADLVAAAAAGDAATTRRVAHAFRSPSATLGALGLADLLTRIEETTSPMELVELCRKARGEFLLVVEGLGRYTTRAGV